MEAVPARIEDRKLKQLRGREISLVKVVWLGAGELDEGLVSRTVRLRYVFEDENSFSWGEL